MQEIRDLVTHPAMRAKLMNPNLDVWLSVCDAMDAVTDGDSAEARVGALNHLRNHFGLEPIELGDDDESAALSAGLSALKLEIEGALNAIHDSRTLVSPILGDISNDHVLATIASVAGPGESNAHMGAGLADALSARISAYRDVLVARDEDWSLYEVDAVLHLLSRVTEYGNGGDVYKPDLNVMVHFAFRPLVAAIVIQARDIDEAGGQRLRGWNHTD